MIRYAIHGRHGVVLIRFEGTIRDRDLPDAYRRLYEDPAWRPGLHELVDVRGADPSQVTAEGLRGLAALTAEYARCENVDFKTAVLVSRDVGYGLARIYEGYSTSPESVRVFRDPAAALAWLGAPADLLDREGMAGPARPREG